MYEPADFIKAFVTDIDAALGKLKPNAKLTHLQKIWLGFCLTGILLTNSVCWAKFERASLGQYKIAGLSWMFREAKIAWHYLLLASVTLVLEQHGITEGVLVLDESDRERSKRTQRMRWTLATTVFFDRSARRFLAKHSDLLCRNDWIT